MTGIGPSELDIMLAFILTSFAYDFPEVSSRAYKLPPTGTFRLYLDEIDEGFQELKYTFPFKRITNIARSLYDTLYKYDTPLVTEIDEIYAIELTTNYIESTGVHYVPKKPMILSDDTGDYIGINEDMIIMYRTERVLDPNMIKEYVYGILRVYSYYKFIDFIINRQFSNFMDINQRVFDLIYGAIDTDVSTGDLEQVTSVSLSGLSVSFASKLTSYSGALSQLASGFNNPTFVQEMNATRDNYHKKFKRKKNIFYNYIF